MSDPAIKIYNNSSWFLEYYRKYKNNEVIVGKELIAELEILYEDYQNPEIIKDFADSEKRIRFIENECKHFEAPFAGKPFLLMLEQKAFIECIFALKIYDDEAGRFIRKIQEILYLVGRKNGKTPLIGAICLAEWFCGETGKKILCGSNDYEQADLMFQAINSMREESPKLERCSRKNIKGIYFGNPKSRKKRGKFSYQNKGSIRKISAKTGAKEGRNIGVGAADEVFEMKDDKMIMPIRQALSTQDEPLYFELTTEGFTLDGYLDKRLDEARKVLRGELSRPRWLIWLYTQDSEEEVWQDEKSWLKSNPTLGVVKKWSFLRKMVEEAKTETSTRAFVLAKDFNIKQNGADVWLSPAILHNPETFDMEKFRNCYYISGNDFAETTDLCSSKLMFLDPLTKKKYFWSHYWIPASKADDILDDKNPEEKNYREWEQQGKITIVKGNSVDTDVIADWHYEMFKEYGVKPFKICYDNRYIKDFKRRIEEIFGDEEDITVNIPQEFKVLTNPMRTMEADFKDKNIIYNDHPIDYWCFCNTAYKTDNFGRIMPSKSSAQSKNRIDGTASGIDCYTGLEWFKSEFMQIIM